MAAPKTKRIALALGLLFAVMLVGVLVIAFMVSREVPFDWDNPNAIEASEARRKLKLYDTSLNSGARGYVRLSPVEINSYLVSLFKPMTNKTNIVVEAEIKPQAGPLQLKRVAVDLTATNLMLYSWAERKFLGLPLEFVVQRGLRIQQAGTNDWRIKTEFLKIGELEIPEHRWSWFAKDLQVLDQPLVDHFKWSTNVVGLIMARSDLGNRPEIRLYTFKPIPSDVR